MLTLTQHSGSHVRVKVYGGGQNFSQCHRCLDWNFGHLHGQEGWSDRPQLEPSHHRRALKKTVRDNSLLESHCCYTSVQNLRHASPLWMVRKHSSEHTLIGGIQKEKNIDQCDSKNRPTSTISHGHTWWSSWSAHSFLRKREGQQ